MNTGRLPALERRQQLLETARRVFARSGFHETSMNDVAAEAGVTKPVLYQHFASKRDLFQAVLNEVGQRLEHDIIEAAAKAGSPREQVENGLVAYLNFVESDGDGFRLLFTGTSREDDEWVVISRRVEGSIARSIAALIEVPGMSSERRIAFAHGMVGLAEGMVRHWLALDSDNSIDHDSIDDDSIDDDSIDDDSIDDDSIDDDSIDDESVDEGEKLANADAIASLAADMTALAWGGLRGLDNL